MDTNKKKGWMCDEGASKLIVAIYGQAANEYVRAERYIAKIKEQDVRRLRDKDFSKITYARKLKDNAYDFFKEDPYGLLLRTSADDICKTLWLKAYATKDELEDVDYAMIN